MESRLGCPFSHHTHTFLLSFPTSFTHNTHTTYTPLSHSLPPPQNIHTIQTQELPPSDIVAAPQVIDLAFTAIAQGVGAGGQQQQRGVFEAAVDLVIDVFQAYDLRWAQREMDGCKLPHACVRVRAMGHCIQKNPFQTLLTQLLFPLPLRNGGSSSSGGGDMMALVQLMVPRALALRGPYEAAVGKGDEESAKGCAGGSMGIRLSLYGHASVSVCVCVWVQKRVDGWVGGRGG